MGLVGKMGIDALRIVAIDAGRRGGNAGEIIDRVAGAGIVEGFFHSAAARGRGDNAGFGVRRIVPEDTHNDLIAVRGKMAAHIGRQRFGEERAFIEFATARGLLAGN
jgi:hypothetical protein